MLAVLGAVEKRAVERFGSFGERRLMGQSDFFPEARVEEPRSGYSVKWFRSAPECSSVSGFLPHEEAAAPTMLSGQEEKAA